MPYPPYYSQDKARDESIPFCLEAGEYVSAPAKFLAQAAMDQAIKDQRGNEHPGLIRPGEKRVGLTIQSASNEVGDQIQCGEEQ